MSVKAAASAGLWSALDLFTRQGVGFLVSIVLARLLTPADFGIIALLGFCTTLSTVFVQGGLTTALIQRHDTTIEQESTVFWINLAASVLFALLLMAAATWVARFYGYPVLSLLMPVAAAQIVLSALGAVQSALLTRALQFGRLAIAGTAAALVSGVIGVALALAGAGIWALAAQGLVLAVVSSALLWAVCSWRPRFYCRPRTIMRLFRFGAYLSLSSFLEVLNSQGFALVLGKFYGASELGLFNRANSTQQFATNTVNSVISRVALPLFSARAGDDAALRRGMSLAVRMSMLMIIPAMTGLAILSDLVTLVLFGTKWLPSAPVLEVLAFAGATIPLHVINLQLLLAQGRSDRFLNLEVVKKVIGVTAVVVGSWFGVMGLTWAILISCVLSFFINAYYTGTTLQYGPLAQLRDSAGPALISVFMGFVVIAVRRMLHLAPLAELVTLSALGVAVYLVGAAALIRFRWPELHEVIASLYRRRPAAAAA